MRLEVDLDQGQVEPWPVFLDYLSYSISNVIMLLLLTMMSLDLVRKVPHIKVAPRWRHQQRAHRMAIMCRRVLIEHQDSCEASKQCNIKRLIWAKEVALIRDRLTPVRGLWANGPSQSNFSILDIFAVYDIWNVHILVRKIVIRGVKTKNETTAQWIL